MSYNAAACRTAIIELLEGTIGTIRTLSANTFKFGAFEGQPEQALKSRLVQSPSSSTTMGWFDVEMQRHGRHPSSPMSAKSNTRLSLLNFRIPVWFALVTPAQETSRKSLLATHESALDDVVEALHFPGNLTQTNASTATNLISGMLFGNENLEDEPTFALVDQDWEAQIAQYEIDAWGVANITQAVS